MTPQERQEFEKMKRDIKAIQTATDVAFVAELTRRLSGIQIRIEDGASTTGLAQLAGDVANVGGVNCAADYQGAVNLYVKDVLIGRIGYYS